MLNMARLALTSVFVLGTAACNLKGTCADSATFGPEADSAGRSPEAPRNAAVGAAAPGDTSARASRAIAEADIVQLDAEQDRIYAMSKNGTLAIVDAKQPGRLALLGKTSLAGEPFEMYRRGDILLTMSNQAVQGDGTLYAISPEEAAPHELDTRAGATIAAVDIANPAAAKTMVALKVPGEIADSRLVGNILYLVTYENAACWNCGTEPRTLVTSFDVTTPSAPRQVDQRTFASPASVRGFVNGWATPWRRSVFATASRLYIGGLAADETTTTDEGVIDVVDITDVTGRLKPGARLTTSGPVMNRWQMDEDRGHLRVITQRGAGRTRNGEKYPDIDTFRVESSSSMVRVGHTTMRLPFQEGLKSVRFDGTRAYAITFRETDPLFTIDLTDPTKPTQKGELQIPGWIFHLEPRGNYLLGLGLDRRDPTGQLNVSLFDVADLTRPALLKRVSFGPQNAYSDDQITSGVLAEDQDRIQKSFRIFYDGLIAVPYSSGRGSCSVGGGGIQLLEWSAGSLEKRGVAPVTGNPRRAIRRDSAAVRELIGISDSNVTAFSIDRRDAPTQLANVTIGTCVDRSSTRPVFEEMPFADDVSGRSQGRDYMHGAYDDRHGHGGCN